MTELEREKINYEAWKKRIAFKDAQWQARIKVLEPKKTVKKGKTDG